MFLICFLATSIPFTQATLSSAWKLSTDTTAVVTGGTKGIGKAIVDELAGSLGIRVLTCSRNGSELEACIEKWKELGYDVCGVAVKMYAHVASYFSACS